MDFMDYLVVMENKLKYAYSAEYIKIPSDILHETS